VEIHHARNCADCGTELKALDIIMEKFIVLAELDEFKALTPAQQTEIAE